MTENKNHSFVHITRRIGNHTKLYAMHKHTNKHSGHFCSEYLTKKGEHTALYKINNNV